MLGLMSFTKTVPAAVPSLFHKLLAMEDRVIGLEEQRAVDIRQIIGIGKRAAG